MSQSKTLSSVNKENDINKNKNTSENNKREKNIKYNFNAIINN